MIEEHRCPVCGKETPLHKNSTKHKVFCSDECRLSEQGKQITHKKYLEKYKTIDWNEVNEKRKQTCFKKYGVENSSQTKESRQKISESKHFLNNDEVNEKRKQTCLKKYGVEYSSQAESTIQKKRQTWLKKYGVDHPAKSPIIREKRSLLSLSTYYNNTIKQSTEFEPLFSEEEWIQSGGGRKRVFRFRCKKCGEVFECYLWNSFSSCRCPKCNPYDISKPQVELVDFIKTITNSTVEIRSNCRDSAIAPLELDIFIPSHSLAIEYNGLAFHSFGRSKHSILNNADTEQTHKYHILNKLQQCEKANIFLLNIFENEWLDEKKKAIWKSIISVKLNRVETKIFARNCVIKEIDSNVSSEFLEENHLQGDCSSSVRLGLFQENQLVAVMLFGKPRYRKDIEWEVVRLSFLKNTVVVGGTQKLFSHFVRKYQPHSIISYADRRYSQGNIYRVLGFEELSLSLPGYFYFKENSVDLFSRITFQKHNLPNVLEKFDPSLSESENMYMNGWRKIYDCGNRVFVWKSSL